MQIGLTRAQRGNKVWHLERAEHTEGYTVLCHFGLWRELSFFLLLCGLSDGRMIKGDQTDVF